MQPQTQEVTWRLDETQDQLNFKEIPPPSYEKAAFNRAVRPNGEIQALNLVFIAGLAAPDYIGILIGIAAQVATNIANEIDSCGKITRFLDKINLSFFVPRGLIALIICWKPSERKKLVTTSAISSTVAKSESCAITKVSHKFETSDGILKFEWLVFPKIDSLVGLETDGSPAQKKKQNAIIRSSKFNILANVAPKETFNFKYSDSSHPVSSGDPLALVTGGCAQLPSISLPYLARKNGELKPGDGSSKPSLAGSGTFGKAKNVALPILSGGLTLLQNISSSFAFLVETDKLIFI
ncbi:hypothetical protein EAF00_000988 [Botryotinia globosa]|nr:hypothetical protein EAF00_000988 [Botryotinia globosa]